MILGLAIQMRYNSNQLEEFLNVKDVIFEENEKLFTNFNFLKED